MIGQVQSATDVFAQFQAYLGMTSAAANPPATAPVCAPCETTAHPVSTHPSDRADISQFERARVTYQEQRSAEPGRSYSVSASLVYERIAYAQSTPRSVDPAAALPAPTATAADELTPPSVTPVGQQSAAEAAVPR